MTGPTLRVWQDLRRSIGNTAALCDAVLLGGPSDAGQAMDKLPEALRLLARRAQGALEALEREP